jgi:hypothetical protein
VRAGAHPTYEELSDERLAAILNHMVTAWGNEELLGGDRARYGIDEIAAGRSRAR